MARCECGKGLLKADRDRGRCLRCGRHLTQAILGVKINYKDKALLCRSKADGHTDPKLHLIRAGSCGGLQREQGHRLCQGVYKRKDKGIVIVCCCECHGGPGNTQDTIPNFAEGKRR